MNFKGPFGITHSVISEMIAQGSGGSVSIASVTAKTGATQLTHCAATKAAVLGTTVNGAVALEKFGICFNAASPGTISTAINAAGLAGPKRAAMASGSAGRGCEAGVFLSERDVAVCGRGCGILLPMRHE